jgi:hypothetical protein
MVIGILLLLLLWLYSPLLGLGPFFSFSLDGGSAHRKAATYAQNTNTE